MKVKVLGIKETGKSFNIAHVQLGNLFGDCLAVQELPNPAKPLSTLTVTMLPYA